MNTNKFVTDNGDGTADIALSRPLDISGTKVATLRMREPTVEDQITMDSTPGSDSVKEISLMANLCMQTPQDLRRLPLRDYNRVQAAFKLFID